MTNNNNNNERSTLLPVTTSKGKGSKGIVKRKPTSHHSPYSSFVILSCTVASITLACLLFLVYHAANNNVSQTSPEHSPSIIMGSTQQQHQQHQHSPHRPQQNQQHDNQKLIRPGTIFHDTQGLPINAHGGGFLLYNNTYYWYGEIKTGDTYLPTANAEWGGTRVDLTGISCYSSKDLVEWQYIGNVLPAIVHSKEEHDLYVENVAERPKVVYNANTNKFVMWLHIDSMDYKKARCGVAISDRPTGPFEYIRSFRPNDGQMARDLTVFVDDDTKGYLFTSSEDNAAIHISQLSNDYLSTITGNYTRVFVGRYMEAPVVFKRNNKYYFIGSGCTAWKPNAARSAVATSIWGPWIELGNPCRGGEEGGANTTFRSQSTYVIPVVNNNNGDNDGGSSGSGSSFVFAADRWNEKNLSDSRYVWLPLTFEEESGNPTIRWQDEWSLDSLFVSASDDAASHDLVPIGYDRVDSTAGSSSLHPTPAMTCPEEYCSDEIVTTLNPTGCDHPSGVTAVTLLEHTYNGDVLVELLGPANPADAAAIVLSAPHGGYLKPSYIADRSKHDPTYCPTAKGCQTVKDAYTLDLALEILNKVGSNYCKIPYVIVNHLHRSKLDANREIGEAAHGSIIARDAWYDFHDYISHAQNLVKGTFGTVRGTTGLVGAVGLLLDVHGYKGTDWIATDNGAPYIQWGYSMSADILHQWCPIDDAFSGRNPTIDDNATTLSHASSLPNQSLECLVRGPRSLPSRIPPVVGSNVVDMCGVGLPSFEFPDPEEIAKDCEYCSTMCPADDDDATDVDVTASADDNACHYWKGGYDIRTHAYIGWEDGTGDHFNTVQAEFPRCVRFDGAMREVIADSLSIAMCSFLHDLFGPQAETCGAGIDVARDLTKPHPEAGTNPEG